MSPSITTISIYNTLTSHGADESALAPLFFDGRIEALGLLFDGGASSTNKPSYCPRHDASMLSYDDFLNKYMQPNLPVVIDGLTKNWYATVNFTTMTSEGIRLLDIESLSRLLGESLVPVHESQITPGKPFGGLSKPLKTSMTVAEYCDWWTKSKDSDPLRKLYLKDWKVALDCADNSITDIYDLPTYFCDDWLNGLRPSYKFVYLGPSGTCTR